MLMQQGSTNGFRASNGIAFNRNVKRADMAVVAMSGGLSYAVCGRGVARNVAKSKNAFGFWRIKRNG